MNRENDKAKPSTNTSINEEQPQRKKASDIVKKVTENKINRLNESMNSSMILKQGAHNISGIRAGMQIYYSSFLNDPFAELRFNPTPLVQDNKLTIQ